MCKVTPRTLPPDGGYGWIITFACAVKKIISIPLVINFGLVLQEGYDETNITSTQGNLAMVINRTVELMISLFGGPLLQRFGYRKVAVIGCLLGSLGIMLTAIATSFWQLVLFFSIILPMGEAAAVPAFAVAINSYFKEKRARVAGIIAFVSALGPISVPFLMSHLLYTYGWRYTVLTLGALYLHCVLAACLLRPVKWYMKVQSTIDETSLLPDRTNIMITADLEEPTVIQNNFPEEVNGLPRCLSEIPLKCSTNTELTNVSSCPNINGSQGSPLLQLRIINQSIDEHNKFHNILDEPKGERKEKEIPIINKPKDKKNFIKKIIDFFDLTLLKDPVFVNIMCGLSVASCAEVSFNLLLPSILRDMLKLETNEIAKLMSLLAFSDLLFRLIGPFITEPWRKSPRLIYLFTLLASIVAKIAMLCTNSFNGMIYVALAMGISKGIRSVYMNVIIPNYVPIHRLAFAMALNRFFRGLIIASIGSISLRIRDATGSYKIPIAVLNIFTLTTILLWTAEFLYFKTKKSVSKIKTPVDDC